jgi:peptide/nickel transport system substrate-binding protein
VGTGPYVLKERVKGDHVTLVRNDRYWGVRPAYAEQVIEVVPDAATREALVRSGEAQVALLPPIADLPAMRADSNVKVLLAPGDRSMFFAIDTVDERQPLLRNVQVRQALNFAINRDAIVQSTLFGAAEPATSVMAQSVFGYCAPDHLADRADRPLHPGLPGGPERRRRPPGHRRRRARPADDGLAELRGHDGRAGGGRDRGRPHAGLGASVPGRQLRDAAVRSR